jgi:conjugative transfer region protein (TIGR03750 family)
MNAETESSGRNAQPEADSTRFRAPVTDRVNVEPAIIRGMTVTEAKVISLVTVPVFLLLGGFLLLITGFWQFILVLGVAGPLVSLWYASAYLQKVKRGRPDGYYTQAIHLWMARRGWVPNKFLSHEGQWDLGRSLDLNLAHPYELKEKAIKSKTSLNQSHHEHQPIPGRPRQ